jgi:hypothetical protein
MKTKLNKLATVNVIEINTEGVVNNVKSFEDTPDGNFQAEATFVAMVKKYTSAMAYETEELQAMLDDGVCDDPALGCSLFLTHSDTESESV